MSELKVGAKIIYDRFPDIEPPMLGVLVEFGIIRGCKGAWVVCNGPAFFAPMGRIKRITE